MFKLNLSVLIMALLIVGCVAQPRVESISDQLAVSYATVSAIANSVALHTQAKTITTQEAEQYLNSLTTVKKHLDTAKAALELSMPKNSLEALQLANKILFEIQIELQRQLEENK